MTNEPAQYDRADGYDLSTADVVAKLEKDGVVDVAVRLTSGTATDYVIEVSNTGDFNGEEWQEASLSATSDIDQKLTIPERYIRLRNTATVADTADAEITASGT